MRKLIELLSCCALVAAGCAATDPAAAPDQATTESGALTARADGPWHRGLIRCPEVPAALNPSADATLLTAYGARGVQIYTCAAPAAGGAPAWTLKAPHAVLFDGFETAATHFAGPSWQALDGSLVTATRAGAAPAPDAADIAWLLLQATPAARPGLFANVTWIQRLNTAGGVAPATGCDADHLGAEVLEPYRADYFFYRAAAAGEQIRQCAAQ